MHDMKQKPNATTRLQFATLSTSTTQCRQMLSKAPEICHHFDVIVIRMDLSFTPYERVERRNANQLTFDTSNCMAAPTIFKMRSDDRK